MEKVVNIMGMGESATMVGDEGERWGVNATYKKVKKLDKLFFMDDYITAQNGALFCDSMIAPVKYTIVNFLKDNPDVELISRLANKVVDKKLGIEKEITEYPLHEAVKLAPGGYFTSTVAYMICYAIMNKFDRIRLYGFEVWSGSNANEYQHQRPCIDFWIAFAMGRGIKVEVPYYLTLTATNNQNYYGYFKGEVKNK